MKLWLVSRTDRIGYDEYDSFVVRARTEREARLTHPHNMDGAFQDATGSWVSLSRVGELHVEEIGVDTTGLEPGVVLASFNAG